jgi:hypothetical protein
MEGKQQIINQSLSDFKKGFLQSMAAETEESMLDMYHLHLTESEKSELMKELKSLGEKWHQKIKGRETTEEKNLFGVVLSVYKKEFE